MSRKKIQVKKWSGPFEVYKNCGSIKCERCSSGKKVHGPYYVMTRRSGDSVKQVYFGSVKPDREAALILSTIDDEDVNRGVVAAIKIGVDSRRANG